MKTTAFGENTVEETVNDGSVKMSIDPDSIDHLMLNLTNLYADPALAVIREYSSNAYDSHVRAGNNTPINVVFPTAGDPVFTVEDFGVGMSKQEIIDVYSKYGLSTKNNTNSEIGAFGLGAKSALAITDRFDITARKNGMETVAYVEKNSKGVGVFHFVSETVTDKPNGFTVKVPLNDEVLVSRFVSHKDFFNTWFPNTVMVDGEVVTGVQYGDNWIEVNPTGLTPVGWVQTHITPQRSRGQWSYFNHRERVSFTIQGISYTFPDRFSIFEHGDVRKNEQLLETIKSVLNYENKVILNVPIGSVDLTPNRESLMATDKTVDTLLALLVDFFDNVRSTVHSHINTLDRSEALFFVANNFGLVADEVVYASSFERGLSNNNRPEFYGFSWNGVQVPSWVKVDPTKVAFINRQAKKVEYASQVPLFESFNSNGYGEGRTSVFIVTVDDMGDETLEKVRKNVKDYARGSDLSSEFIALVSDDKEFLSNEWVSVYPTVTLDELYETALNERRVRRSNAAQNSSPRSGIAYAYVDFTGVDFTVKQRELAYTTAENVGDGEGWVFVSLSEETSPYGSGLSSLEDSVKDVISGKGGLSSKIVNDFIYTAETALEGKKLVFLNKNKKGDAFQKRHPRSLPLVDVVRTHIQNTLAGQVFNREALTSTVSFHMTRQAHRRLFTNVQYDRKETFMSSVWHMVNVAENVSTETHRLSDVALREAVESIALKTDLYRFSLLFSVVPADDEAVRKIVAESELKNYTTKLSLLSQAITRYSKWKDTEIDQAIILMNNV